ncbi:MAG TPA: AccI family restriction endonuclease [Candidatus Hydrogenedentes bacterium]|nr:AccI family restriction endonuclease [Candidatus Hydrogenedentota bacterium]HOV74238.1 AccI family restriction endonuclease [Candidatus Hydrogenedentota bacterium]
MTSNNASNHPFERELDVSIEDIAYLFRGFGKVPWSGFLLNPRRLRGSDFLMRWSQGVWSEERLTQAVNDTGEYFALPYGPSSTAPDGDVREFELYFERLKQAGLGNLKRPDLLIFCASDKKKIDSLVRRLGGLSELPFTSEENTGMKDLLSFAVLAIECEHSLWRAQKMPDFGTPLTPQKRLGGRLGLKKTAVLPTIILKEEDRKPLRLWQRDRRVPVHIWHAFFDAAYGISLADAERLISNGDIEPTTQTFQAPGGATSQKTIYKIYYRHGYPLASTVEEPKILAASIEDRNGHILPYVRFDGGTTRLSDAAHKVLDSMRDLRRG